MGNILTSNKAALSIDVNEIRPVIHEVQNAIKAMDKVISNLQNVVTSNQNDVTENTERTNDVKKNEEGLLDITNNMCTLHREMRDLKKHIDQLTKMVDNKIAETNVVVVVSRWSWCCCCGISRPLCKYSSNIQVFGQHGNIFQDILEKVTSQWKRNSVNLRVNPVSAPRQSVRQTIPELLICLNSSRLGTDIENSLRNISASQYSMIGLVIVHPQAEHAHPAVSSETNFPEYSSVLGGIFDLAYLSDEGGVYDCKLNTENLKKIYEFVAK